MFLSDGLPSSRDDSLLACSDCLRFSLPIAGALAVVGVLVFVIFCGLGATLLWRLRGVIPLHGLLVVVAGEHSRQSEQEGEYHDDCTVHLYYFLSNQQKIMKTAAFVAGQYRLHLSPPPGVIHYYNTHMLLEIITLTDVVATALSEPT